jgi:hypothetical protein
LTEPRAGEIPVIVGAFAAVPELPLEVPPEVEPPADEPPPADPPELEDPPPPDDPPPPEAGAAGVTATRGVEYEPTVMPL